MKVNWKIFKLGDLVIGKGEYGINAAACEYNPNLNTYLRITDISEDGRFIEKGKKSVNHPDAEKFVLKEGDITFARTGASTGKTYLYNVNDGKLIFAGFLIRFRPDSLKLNPTYLKYVTQTSSYKNWVSIYSARTGQPGINGNEYGEFEFNLPPLPQQEKIAKILCTVDTIIEQTETAIAKYQAIKQGLMHNLFTRGIDVNTGLLRPTAEDAPKLYKESVLGLIPLDWDKETLRDISDVNQGLQIAISQRYKTEGENRFLYITIQYLNNIESDSYKYYIENPFSSVICYEDDILMVRTGNTGMIVTDVIGVFHNNFFKIDYNNSVLKEYLVYYLKRDITQDMILNYAGTTTIPDLKHGDFYKIPFNKPNKIEQKLVVDKLKSVDQKIQTEQQTLAKYQQLKAGLMQDLLTGKVEVSVG